MRCIYESLALKYRFAIEQLQQATGKRFGTLHVLGGGAKDGLLCRMTADAAGVRVVAGPVEATALGKPDAAALCTRRTAFPGGGETHDRPPGIPENL